MNDINLVLCAIMYVLIFLCAPQACATPLEKEIGLRRKKYQDLIKCHDVAFFVVLFCGFHFVESIEQFEANMLVCLWGIESLGFLLSKLSDKMDDCVYEKGYDGIFRYIPNN